MTTMIKKRVSELEGAQLDWAVAKALGLIPDDEYWSFIEGVPQVSWFTSAGEFGGTLPLSGWMKPSENWGHGGPIIERERIELEWWQDSNDLSFGWDAVIHVSNTQRIRLDGPTPLIAAMRAFVASKLGDEVEVEVPA